MGMTIYKLFADALGDSVGSLDIQIDGTITSVMMTGSAAGQDVLNDGWQAEVSFLSTNTFAANDVRGSIMTVQSRFGVLSTEGGHNSAINMTSGAVKIPVSAGERVHLHLAEFGTLTARQVHCYLYVEDKGTARIPGRRR